MKKIFTFCVSLLAALSVFAYDFQSGDLFYNITSSSAPYTVEVTQQSQYYNSNYSGVDTVVIPETVTYDSIIYSVTSIGESAFNHSKLTTITIPNTVTSIGEYAFAYCQKLTSVAIGSGVKTIHMAAFNNCSALRTITIPANVKEIYNQAFTGASISTIYMEGTTPPSLLQSKSDGSIFRIFTTTPTCYVPCSAVASYKASTKWKGAVREFVAEFPYTFTIASANTSLGTIAITQQPDCSTAAIFEAIPNTGCYFTQWSDGNTDNPRTLKVTQDTRLTASFASSTYVVNLIAGANGAVSGAGTYDHGTTATITAIPNDGYHFTQWSDGNTDNPRSIVVVEPISLTALFEENYTQEHCQIIYTSTDGDVVTPWVTYNFGADIVSNTYADGQGVITFDGPVTAIGDTAFANCSSLESIIIPDRVTVIGDQAFQYCTYLKDVTIGNRVESIGTAAFNNCYSLRSIIIPQSVKYIYNYAFVGASLNSIYVNRTIPPTLNPEREDPYMVLGTGMVDVCYILCGKLASYQASEWKTKGQVREFVERPSYLLTVQSVDKTMGTATITQDIDCETQIATIAATPYDGYRFVQWSDGNTDNPRSWVVTEDTYLEAIFEKSIDPTWQITYTSTDGNIVTPNATDVFGANIVSNTYENGVGTITFDGPVTSIGNSAFKYCSSLISITIPNSVMSIGVMAFYRCKSLASITIPNSVTSIGDGAFSGCSSLTSITIPNSVTNIERNAFVACSSITSVTIPNSVTSIGINALGGCDSLTSIVVEDGNATYDSRNNCNAIIETATNTLVAGCKNTIIPNSVTAIGGNAFSGYRSLTSVTIPNSVTSIGYYAFFECSFLTSITIPNSVTNIGYYAFNGCSSLTSITIPNSVMSIEYGAFAGCSSLTSVTIPNSVTSIGVDVLGGCASLTSIVVEDDNATYDSRNNCNAIIETATNTLVAGCKNTIIPNSVTSIGDFAFNGCSSLTSVTIPNNVTSIGEVTFSGCSSLTSVTIPSSVTSIGDYAFYGCYSLSSLTISNSVTSIGRKAFYDCSSLDTIHVEATTPPALEDSTVFMNTPSPLCVIPCGTFAAYEASDWAQYASEFVEDGCIDPTWQILYTSIDSTVVTPYKTDVFGANIVSNEYQDGQGVITFDGSVTSIGVLAFCDCTSLTSIAIPNGVTSIEQYAFRDCSFLISITIPNSITSIGWGAFQSCSTLTSITIPNSVTRIGEMAFASCDKLTSMVVESGNIIYDSRENCDAIIETATNTLIAGCKKTIIPNSVTSIGNNAFYGCSSLTSITIPNSVTSIGDSAFSSCTSLTSITLGSGVTSIGWRAFDYCSSLTSITIPESVTSIGDWAFDGCSSLDTIHVEATTPPALEDSTVFMNTPSPLCVIPCGTLAEYEMSKWKNYVEAFVFDDTCEDKWCGDNLYWKYRNGVLTLIGTGDMYDYASDIDVPWYDVHDKITSINIPNGVSKIGNNAFASCISLDEIYVEAAMPPALGNNALASSPSCFIPCGAIATYQSSNWAQYVSEFVEVCPAVVKAKVPASWENDDITVWVWTDGAGTEYPTTKEGDWYVYTHSDTEEFNIIFKSGTGWKDEIYHRTQTVDIKGITENTCLEIQPTTGKATYTIVDCEMMVDTTEYFITYTSTNDSIVTPKDVNVFGANIVSNTYENGVGTITFDGPVTSIGYRAFYECSALTSITIPSSVKSIENYAFYNCYGLTLINIPNSVTSIGSSAFYSCFSLTSITIPNSVTSIENNAFSYCSSLTSVTFGSGVTSIGNYAFEYCYGLTSITIPNSVTTIGSGAFSYCSGLTSIVVDGGNTTYDSRENCNTIIETATNTLITGCQNTIIPNSVTSIGKWAFSYCSGLTFITIPNSVTSIGEWAFYGCSGLTFITIPNSVTSIGEWAFCNCSGLTSIVVDVENTTYDSRENCNAIIETATNTIITGCQNTIIPNSVTSIGNYAFERCYDLTSITIPNSVTSIGSHAFSGCSSLTSITIPNSVTSIGGGAFEGCSRLTSINIPNSVTSIGNYAFEYCSWLDTIHIEAITPPTLGTEAVTSSPTCYIPCGTLSAYQASDWASQVSEFVEEGCAPVQQCGDNLFWEYADGLLTITGTGDMYDYADDKTGPAPWYDVRGSITTINMPNEMTKIGDYAFYKCTEVTSINMPTSLTAIGEKAFAQDTKLACDIILPASMTTIASRAFFNCQAVTAFHLEATTPPTIPNDAFERTTAPIHVPCGYGHVYGKHTQWGVLNLEMCELLQDNVYYYPIDGHTARAVTYHSNPTDTIVIPSAVVIDGVPRTVTEVADFAFTDCANLPAIYFSEGLEYIGERAFVRCYGLQGTIVLPATLETIGERAFSYCNNVDRYTIQAMTPPVLGANAFTGDNKNALFYISCEAMDDYKVATNWSSLKSRLRDACLNIYHYNTPLGTNGVYTTEDTLVASIYYRRQFTPYRWETLYLPFEVDRVTVLEDGVEYDLTAWDIVYGGHYFIAKPDGWLNMEIIFGFTDELDAHTPYIIQFKDDYYRDKIITFYGKESWNKLSTSFEVLSSSSWMQIAGNTTLQDQLLEKPVYMLRSGLDFILQKTTTTLHPFECYVMPYATPSGAPARMNVRFRGDVPTAVESVKGNESHLTYTVDGYTLTIYPQGQAFSIYSLNGALIYSCEAGKEAVECELNSGCYLLHAGTEAHKIML